MRHRMEGMINAAKVKATSDRNEEYRIAKAKLSCLSILYDQARQFKAEKQGSREDFERIEAGLLKEIADAQKSLRKYNVGSHRIAITEEKSSISRIIQQDDKQNQLQYWYKQRINEDFCRPILVFPVLMVKN